jgi:hypothetical protein
MKQRLLLLTFSMLIYVHTHAQITFQRALGTSGNDRNYSLVKAHDGGYVTAGYTENFSSTLDIYIIKTNIYGEVEWSKTIGNADNQRAWQMIADSKGGYVITGATTNGADPDQAFMMRLDDTGRIDWQIFLEDTVHLALYGLSETKSGHFIGAGLRKSTADSFDFYLAKVSSTGNLITAKSYPHPGNQEAFNIIEDANGNYVATGWCKIATMYNNINQMMVMKTDSNLNKANSFILSTFTPSLPNHDTRGYDLVQNRNHYYIAGWTNHNSTILMKLDTTFNNSSYVQNHYLFNTVYRLYGNLAFDIKKSKDNQLLIAGYRNNGQGGGRDALFMKLDLNGQYTFVREYGGSETDGHWPSEVIEESDNTFAFISSTNTYGQGNYDFYLLRMNSIGITPCNSFNLGGGSSTYASTLAAINTGEESIGISSNYQLNSTNRNSITTKICCKITAPTINDFNLCVSDKGKNISLRRSILLQGVNYEFFVDNVFYSNDPDATLYIDSSMLTAQIKIRLSADDNTCTPDSVIYTINMNNFEKHVFDSNGCQGDVFVYKAPDLAPTNSIKWIGNVRDTVGRTFHINYSDSVYLQYTISGCPFQDTFAVTINPLPEFSLPDTNFCPGTFVELTAPENSSYNWYNKYSTQQVSLTDTGFLWLKVTDSNSCTYTDTFRVGLYPTPASFNLGADDSVCSNTKKWLYSPYTQFGVTYEWNYGEHYGVQYYADPGRMHVFRIININGCFAADSLYLGTKLTPETGLSKNLDLCLGDMIYANTYNNAQYKWNGSAGQDSFEFSGQNTLVLEILLPNNCKTIDTIEVTTKPDPEFSLGADTIICVGDSLLLSGPDNMAAYLWSTMSTSQSITVSSPGLYFLWVQAVNGCSFEDEIQVDTQTCETGLRDINVQKFLIYPNPAGTYFVIRNSDNKMEKPQQLRMMSMEGKMVYERMILLEVNEKLQIDVSHLPSGLYFVHLGNHVQRIAVMRE